ncbi:winged helix-turn-helix domain-containing protein [Pseudoalteromonas denitrificans]|uniref:DNA-binding winged helix-turn-helix (WHTH) domain-containing protein n=1 Tax=Pseudoalteromonas denitrificans DSM 6059 TaxID=1123010 RepID=A0A1I1JQH0_9GAMM|nr:winged helix-turn-helix domain-containing protein [Pseudoalteromonas denitrificans]SFC48113.1 DNA-binding winged helix-turn-helix (wHTH) domain-containing protein [Pseudoalteromonas denitrificans DSM 6059]
MGCSSFDLQNKLCSSPFYLNNILVSPELSELLIDEKVIKLEPKVMAVLVMLAENDGQVISRKTLMDEVWHGLVVGDEVVTRTIFELRRAFSDSAKNPLYFATISKKGYRCQVSPQRLPIENNLKNNSQFKKYYFSLIFICIGVLLVIPYIYSKDILADQTKPSIKPQQPIQSQPETSLPGLEREPAISKNGQWLAFIHSSPQDKQDNVFIKNLITSEVIQLTKNASKEAYPQWSDDGKTVVFVRCKLKNECRIVSKQLDDLTENIIYRNEKAISCLAWSEPLNMMIFCQKNNASLVGSHLRGIDIVSHKMRSEKSEIYQSYKLFPKLDYLYYQERTPIFTRDGKTLVFVRGLAGNKSEVIKYDFKHAHTETLFTSKSFISHLTLSRTENFLLFSHIQQSRWGLWYTILNSEQQQKKLSPLLVSSDKSTLRQPVINPINDRVYYMKSRGQRDIIHHDINENTNMSLVSSTANDYDGQFSNHTDQLAFISNRTGAQEVWLANAKGKDQQRLTTQEFDRIDQIHWSKDDKKLAIQINKDKQNYLFIIDVSSKRTIKKIKLKPYEQIITWSTDNTSFVLGYLSGKEYSLFRLYLVDNSRKRLVKDAGPLALESESGSVLYYYNYKAQALHKLNLVSAQDEIISNNIQIKHFTNAEFSADNFYYIDDKNYQIQKVNLTTGQRKVMNNILPSNARLSNVGFNVNTGIKNEFMLFDVVSNSQGSIRSFKLPYSLH